jgi:phage baseplate assembly protein W
MRHLGFPMSLDPRGRTASPDDEAYLRGLIETVLFTRPGERVNRPDFGSGVDRLVFAPSGDELAGATRAMVHAAIQQWLGDLVRVEDVAVTAEESTLQVRVVYLPMAAGPGGSADQRRVLQVSGGSGGAS